MLSRTLNPKKFQIVVVSPRSYFVFTPLLASTAVGTLEFRTALEPVRSKSRQCEFLQGWADDVNFHKKTVIVEEAVTHSKTAAVVASSTTTPVSMEASSSVAKKDTYGISYDKLVVCVGCYSQTFGTKGVKEHAFFLKDAKDARKIRKRILKCKAPLSCGLQTDI